MAELRQILEKTISGNQQDQQLALDFLRQGLESNFCEFLKQLSGILKEVNEKPHVRQAAGLQLKNALVSKDEKVKQQVAERWLTMPQDIRDEIKNSVLQTLGTETTRPSIAAQCVASIACVELPHGVWQESITCLMRNVVEPNSTEMLKESSLEALGYICQDLESTVLLPRSQEILTAIVHGMKKEEASNYVRVAATKALLNSLEFTRASFENDNERNAIMQVVCEATQIKSDNKVCIAALQCLVNIMSLYYQFMEPYMRTALFPITISAITSDVDEICLQGIEFWSNVCDEEIELAVEAEEAAEQGRPPEHVSKFYAKGALQHLLPLLTQTLTRQDESDDDDEWNPAKAAGVCLMLMAQCVGDEVVVHVLPFITTNISSPEWRYRDAAIMSFGSILEGPDPEKLKPLVQQALPTIITLLDDQQTVVRDTAAWCIGRVCEICQEVVVNPDILMYLLPRLSQGLHQEPRVAANICWAISSLAVAAYEQASEQNTSGDSTCQPDTYILSSCFEGMINELLKTTDRPDAHQSNLRNAAYEAVMELIKNSPKDCYPIVQSTTLTVLKKLEILRQMEGSVTNTSDMSQLHDLQSLLCATLQSVLRKVQKSDALNISDAIMQSLLQIMSHSAGRPGSSVMEDALMATSTLIEAIGEDFIKYMDHFKPFLVAGLRNHAEHQVCQAAVGIVADLCRGLESKVLPYVDELMSLCLEILTDANMDKAVKPQVVSIFGDLALAIGPEFFKYLETILTTLMQASTADVDRNDFDSVDYLNQLRESCLEAYTGILQGFKGDSTELTAELQRIQPFIPQIVDFLDRIAVDKHQPDAVLGAASGLIGDLLSVYGVAIATILDRDTINDLLTKARRAKSSKTKTLGTWATKELKKLKPVAT